MVIGGTSGKRGYYVCASGKNGRCSVRTSLRADIAQQRILGAMRDRLLTNVDHIRKELARLMGEESRSHEAELKDRRGRLQKAEKRVAGLVDVLASGERSSAVSVVWSKNDIIISTFTLTDTVPKLYSSPFFLNRQQSCRLFYSIVYIYNIQFVYVPFSTK